MASNDEAPKTASGPWAWLSNRAGLIILVVLGAIVGLRLMSSWIKWMLIAMVVAATVYLVRGARRRAGGG
jgi:uncharacterized membrane protein YfcA